VENILVGTSRCIVYIRGCTLIDSPSLEDFDEEIDNAEIVGDSEPDEDVYIDGDEGDEDDDDGEIDLDGLDGEIDYDEIDLDDDMDTTDSDDSDSDPEAAAPAPSNRELTGTFFECVGPASWRCHVFFTVFSQAPSKGYSNLTAHLYRDHETDVLGYRQLVQQEGSPAHVSLRSVAIGAIAAKFNWIMYEKLGEDLAMISRAAERPLFVDAHSNVETTMAVFVQMTVSWGIFAIEIFSDHPTALEPVQEEKKNERACIRESVRACDRSTWLF
jgi:hypothetical protein